MPATARVAAPKPTSPSQPGAPRWAVVTVIPSCIRSEPLANPDAGRLDEGSGGTDATGPVVVPIG